MEKVILVDKQDREIGLEEKLKAHQEGKLHRALSVFVFNRRGELMLQKRAPQKYHCGNLWSNTVCSHPRKNEADLKAAHRRLREEVGFDCDLSELFSFVYRAKFKNGLIEHEFDHVFLGFYDQEPVLNPNEAIDWKWISPDKLKKEISQRSEAYTFWLKKIFNQVLREKERSEKKYEKNNPD